jgi:hypothetical protein
MDINRHNYETFFLLYVDNELTTAEKLFVDDFVQQNPDLASELAMLQQVVLEPMPVSFAGKANLLKATPQEQEQLLLLLDGELDAAAVTTARAAITNNPAMRAEWNLLQQTQLNANDTIVFAHKEQLYRHEAEKPVVAMRWWRVAAAAVVFGLGAWGVLQYINRDVPVVSTGDNGTVAVQPAAGNNGQTGTEQNTATTPAAVLPNTLVNSDKTDMAAQPVNKTGKENNATSNAAPQNDTQRSTTTPVNNMVSNMIPKRFADRFIDNTSNLDRSQNINKENGNETVATNVLPVNNNQPAEVQKNGNNLLNRTIASSPVQADVPTTNADYAKAETADADNVSQYMTPADRKGKRSGLLRKVTRFFKRNTEGRKDGNGLQIAGFEIAAR